MIAIGMVLIQVMKNSIQMIWNKTFDNPFVLSYYERAELQIILRIARALHILHYCLITNLDYISIKAIIVHISSYLWMKHLNSLISANIL